MNRLLPLAVLCCACRNPPDYAGAFDVPSALGILQPEVGGPFEEPIGFVGNQHGGQIALLALKQGRYLTDDPTVSFLRGNQLATGRQRVLAAVLPYAHPDGTVTVFALDRAFDELVEIPYVTGFDDQGFPIEPPASVEDVRFVDADGTGDAPQLVDIEVKTGWTATEDWTVTFDGSVWRATGSRSGTQAPRVVSGERFTGTDRNLAFTVEGEATKGDHFLLRTVSGSTAHDAGGRPLHARMAPDQSVAAVVLHDPVTDTPVLRFLDPERPADLASAPDVPLDATARPGRLAWDAGGADLFVADTTGSAFWHLHWPEPADRAAFTTTRVAVPWPTLDVAPLLTDVGRQVFLVPIDEPEVWSYDLEADALRDVNTWVEGPQGVRFSAPVSGIEAMAAPYLQLETDDDGERHFDRAVAVSLTDGRTVFADERTACLVADRFGPQTAAAGAFSSNDHQRSFDSDSPFGARLATNVANDRHAMANPCPGITRSQTWVMVFDSIRQGWVVTGTRSGEQETLAREDRRYTSDDGEISFQIVSGQTPSRDGWDITIRMVDGLTTADGDEDGIPATLEVTVDQPTDPVYFQYEVGPADRPRTPQDLRPHVLVAGAASDRVVRIDPQEGSIDATWD